MEEKELTNFLLKARTKTYAGSGGKVASILQGSEQLEYTEKEWLYRDIYYTGQGIFMGMETIYCQNKPIWAMSYYGNFKEMTEKEIDDILKKALLEKWHTARTWEKLEWQKGDYKYICEPDFEGSIKEMAGLEKILKQGKQIYTFFYAGGLLN